MWCGQVSPNTSSDSNTLSWSTTQEKSFSMDEIKKHNKEDDCRTSINSLVYNLTSFSAEHKWWKDKIIALCGVDGSAAFNGQHWGQEEPLKTLKTFQIWILK